MIVHTFLFAVNVFRNKASGEDGNWAMYLLS